MVQLALAVPGGCLVGWLIGVGLDKHFHTEWIQIVGHRGGRDCGVPADLPDGFGIPEAGR